MSERYIATADFGSSKIGLCVARIENGGIQIIYYREKASTGIRHSCIFNAKKVEDTLKEAIREAEDELNLKIAQLVVGIPRYAIRTQMSKARQERSEPSSIVEREEVEEMKSLALGSYPIEDPKMETMYGAVAQSFNADELIGESEDNIIGTCCENLEGNFNIFIGPQRAISYIDKTLGDIGISVAKKVFTPSTTADAVLTDDEKDMGVALVETGGGVTSVTIYKDKILRHYSSIPFGGKTVTKDIQSECCFTDSLAENIKLAYGACMPDKIQSLSDKILQINDEERGSYEHLPVKFLSSIVNARYREILEAILYHIQESGYADKIRSGIVLTGGAAAAVNLAALLKNLSGFNVRIGYPRCKLCQADGCQGIFELSAATSLGLVIEGSKDKTLDCQGAANVCGKKENADKVPAPADEDTVFNPDAWTMKEENKQETVKEKRKNKSRKAPTWDTIKELTLNIFDKTLGSAYGEMGNDTEKQ